jgi:glycosyltransferase involved in cell wall biosynthesis
MAAADAVVQDVNTLRKQLDGDQVHYLYPGSAPGTRIPRYWWGVTRLFALRRDEKQVDLHHIFNPDPYPFFVLRYLQKPVVYTAVSGLGHLRREVVGRLAEQVHTLVVPTASDQERLRAWNITNTMTIGPGIETGHFTCTLPPPGSPFTILMASAPWTPAQFHSKGVDALLAVAQQRPDLRLMFLWRGVLFDEMRQRVQAAGLADRVEIINQLVDINATLARVHASIVLAADKSLIKAYPHSLLESLAAGKPVIISSGIPLAKIVAESGCGELVDQVDASHVLAAVDHLAANYEAQQQAAQAMPGRYFVSPLRQYETLYDRIVSDRLAGR